MLHNMLLLAETKQKQIMVKTALNAHSATSLHRKRKRASWGLHNAKRQGTNLPVPGPQWHHHFVIHTLNCTAYRETQRWPHSSKTHTRKQKTNAGNNNKNSHNDINVKPFPGRLCHQTSLGTVCMNIQVPSHPKWASSSPEVALSGGSATCKHSLYIKSQMKILYCWRA